ncbi:chromosome segregation protein SMC [Acidiphilium sp. PA]|uniref:chromosome segregation protein SMC n=1 Tax=Acidiphilium sp. PA TaxID=2871705 RepID=UPI002244F0C7|nr:chromosome segregation protein SMC [Acidiphilium sp. PA]MCW8308316.1 chromosome segregation protein SMC [Acidiphilium sp. PA]
MPARFARIRIAGFKSFADPTSIEILPGLTGIVGPNGCGKSNVVDALRWAMGEASAKSMRGGEMDDVIFAGTLSRAARSVAEVAISLTDTAGLAPAPFHADAELQITRKIERGSGSTYRVNGRETRARDVAVLFADLASGARNSAMISQGRVSALVNARPDERRAILEEAAGITGLHSRRHEAELKLRAAEQNLTRAEDLRTQQEARLADLQKQARQANRYRNLSGAIRDAETEYLATEHHIARSRQRDAQTALAAAQTAVVVAQRERDEVTQSERGQTDALPALRARESEARTALERARIQLEHIDAEIKRIGMARTEAEARLAGLIRDHQHAERTATSANDAKQRLIEERSRLEVERLAAPESLAAANVAADHASAALQDAEARAQSATEAAAHLAAGHQAINARLKLAREQAAQTRNRAAQAAAEHQRAVAELIPPERTATLDAARNAAVAAYLQAESAQREAQAAVQAAEQARGEATAVAAALRTDSLAADAAVARIKAEVDALGAVLAQKFGREAEPLLDQISVPTGFENALGAALRDELAASTQPTAPRHWRALPPIDAPHALSSLAAHIEAPEALHRALGHILLLPEGADGDTLQQSLQPGETLVSVEGGVWRWDGYVTRAGAPSEAGLRLAQRNRLNQLQQDLSAATIEAARHKRQRGEAEQAEHTARQTEELARTARKAADQQLERARGETRTTTEAASRIAAEAERKTARALAAAELVGRLEAEHAGAAAALATVETELAALPDVTALRADVDRTRARVTDARRAETEARHTVQRLTSEMDHRNRRLGSIDREIADWTERAADATARITDLAARLREARTALESLPTDSNAADTRDSTQKALAEAEHHHVAAAAALKVAEQQSETLMATLREAEQRLSRAREALILAESGVREADFAWGTIAERILERFGVDPALPSLTDPTAESGERARKRFERLTRERDEMGPVNLRAEIEVGEIEERLAGIERERAEISAAISKLRGSIGHLNREGRERLSNVFTEIDRHFQALFTRMFGGGRAHLALTGSDDPLEAGLEIFAEPPGKKLASLSLLSGGEQALTALSLIFAVFRCNPAPISVLDEVDAPLDDANVDRFCTLLEDMARETGTRFLVVTHHHLTMARMDRLYGVTMQERGISRVLSVDLGTATALVDQAVPIAAE